MKELLDRADIQIKLAKTQWRMSLADVLLELIAEIEQKVREKAFWKREFYKQEERAVRAEKIASMQETRARIVEDKHYIGNIEGVYSSKCDV